MLVSGQFSIIHHVQPEHRSRGLRTDIDNILLNHGKDKDHSQLNGLALDNINAGRTTQLWDNGRAATTARSLSDT